MTTPTVSALPQLRAALRYEHFDADDYALDGVLPSTVPKLLSLGAAAYDYDLMTVMLSWRYRFGATEAAPADGESMDKPERE